MLRYLFRELARLAKIVALVFWSLLGLAAPVGAEVQSAIEYKLVSYWDDYGPYSDDGYFVTSFPAEIAALDVSVKSGAIVLTGEVFSVWSEPEDGALPTCRFWSARFFSHFFTPYEAECAAMRTDSSWQYEGMVFYLRVPDENGNCASGMTVLYRLYNNSIAGTPHHRLTTSAATRDRMLAAGWVFEGDSRTRAFACVPLASPSTSN